MNAKISFTLLNIALNFKMPLQLFDNVLKWQGFPIQEAKVQFKHLLNTTNVTLEQRKKAIVNHHIENNNFYNKLLKSNSILWEELPVLTKRDLHKDIGHHAVIVCGLKDAHFLV